ncbi:MAG: NAD(P)H-dependent oxidoreductase [Azospirillaceae bacterium]
MQFLVFLGSVRETAPPRPARLGARVAEACRRLLVDRGHDATLVDPLEVELGGPFKPHFAYARARAPAPLDRLADAISAADGYVMASPEYNHSMSPALAHLLNHFGASLFAWKPSAIVTYSAGQWGGARAAMGMRGFLSELGCLPVSAMVHIPRAQDVLDEAGAWTQEASRWDGYVGRTLTQLEWWAEAARRQRADGAAAPTEAFAKDPSQRNAP